jgi:hypothetical protein
VGHPNEELTLRGFAAFAAGDMATLDEVFTDDIVWHVSGRGPLCGDYEGREAVSAYFGRLAQETGAIFRIEVHDLLANDGFFSSQARFLGSDSMADLVPVAAASIAARSTPTRRHVSTSSDAAPAG